MKLTTIILALSLLTLGVITSQARVASYTAKDSPAQLVTQTPNRLIGYGQFRGEGQRYLFTSFDGMNWSTMFGPFSWNDGEIFSLNYLNGKIVATATDGRYYISRDDGVTWEAFLLPAGFQLDGKRYNAYDMAYGNGIYVATGVNEIFVSIDAMNWQQIEVGYGAITSIEFGGGVFIANVSHLDINGVRFPKLIVSANGRSWVEVTLPNINETIRSHVYGNGRWVATTVLGQVGYSIDGYNWTKAARMPALHNFSAVGGVQPLPPFYYGLSFVAGSFWVGGNPDAVLRSMLGETFDLVHDSLHKPINGNHLGYLDNIVYKDNVLIALGVGNTSNGGGFLNSLDGGNWSREPILVITAEASTTGPLPTATPLPIATPTPRPSPTPWPDPTPWPGNPTPTPTGTPFPTPRPSTPPFSPVAPPNVPNQPSAPINPNQAQIEGLEAQIVSARKIRNGQQRNKRIQTLQKQINSLKIGSASSTNTNVKMTQLQSQLKAAKRIKNPQQRAKRIKMLQAQITELQNI